MAKLNLLRQLWGAPLVITSGVRCAFWNEHVGGSPESTHMRGMAVDIAVSCRTEADQLAELAEKLSLGGIGVYPRWVHVDVGPKRRWAGA